MLIRRSDAGVYATQAEDMIVLKSSKVMCGRKVLSLCNLPGHAVKVLRLFGKILLVLRLRELATVVQVWLRRQHFQNHWNIRLGSDWMKQGRTGDRVRQKKRTVISRALVTDCTKCFFQTGPIRNHMRQNKTTGTPPVVSFWSHMILLSCTTNGRAPASSLVCLRRPIKSLLI
jgi:hypothetical protein